MRYEDHDLCVKGLSLLISGLGTVEAERFVALMNREAGDYTEWRRKHLYPDETVRSLAEKAKKTGELLRTMDGVEKRMGPLYT